MAEQEKKDVPSASDVEAEDVNPPNMTTSLIGYSLAFIIFGSQVSILGPTIKPLAEQLNVAEPALSPLFTALGISCIISGAPSGWLVDMMPTHHVLIGSLLVQAIGFSLVPLMTSVWALTALWFVICFSYNFTNSAVFTSLTWMFPKRAGGSLNLVLAMFGIGSFLIPLGAFMCREYLGSELVVFWMIGGLSVLSTIPFFFVESPQRPAPMGAQREGGESAEEPRQHRGLEMTVTVSMVLLVFLSTTAETSVGNWINTYSQEVVGLNKADAAWVNAAFWGFFTIGRVVGALISHLTTPAGLLLTFTPLSIIGTSIPILFPLWGYDMTKTSVLALAVLSGMGNSAGYANAIALMERYVPVTGAINGVFGMVAGGACMVGPNIVAFLSSYYGSQTEDGEFRYWFQAMAWTGLFFYCLHFPAIFTTLIAGQRLIKLLISEQDELEEPLLSGAEEGHAVGGSHHAQDISVRSNRSSAHMPIHRPSEDLSHGFTSFPGHIPTVGSYGSGSGSMRSMPGASLLAGWREGSAHGGLRNREGSGHGGQRGRDGSAHGGVASLLGGRTPLDKSSG